MMWKHLKSGGVYTLLRFGLREEDLTPVAIYQEATPDGKLNPDGKVWVRPAAEFCDGRFVPLRHYRTTKKLIDEASYMINNPSAWETEFDHTASDVIAKLVAALDDQAPAPTEVELLVDQLEGVVADLPGEITVEDIRNNAWLHRLVLISDNVANLTRCETLEWAKTRGTKGGNHAES